MNGTSAAIFGFDPFWLSTALLFITYGVLVIDRLNRSIVALLGGGLMIACGVVDQGQAIAGQDFNTLALLIGMMLLVAIARPSGNPGRLSPVRAVISTLLQFPGDVRRCTAQALQFG